MRTGSHAAEWCPPPAPHLHLLAPHPFAKRLAKQFRQALSAPGCLLMRGTLQRYPNPLHARHGIRRFDPLHARNGARRYDPLRNGARYLLVMREMICIELVTSDCKLEASREVLVTSPLPDWILPQSENPARELT